MVTKTVIRLNDKPFMVINSRIKYFCLIDQLFSEKEIYQAVLARNILLSGIRN